MKKDEIEKGNKYKFKKRKRKSKQKKNNETKENEHERQQKNHKMKKDKMIKRKIIVIGNIGAKVSGSSLSFKRYYKKLISINSDNIIFVNTFRNRNNFLSNALKSFSILIRMFFIINNCIYITKIKIVRL